MDPLAPPAAEIDARRVQAELYRRMTPGEKLAIAWELNETAEALARAGLRQRFPNADEREIFLRLAAMRLTREQMIGAYDWDPEAHGC